MSKIKISTSGMAEEPGQVYAFMDRFICAQCGQLEKVDFGMPLAKLTREAFPITATATCHGETETRHLTWEAMASTQMFFSGEDYTPTGLVQVRR